MLDPPRIITRSSFDIAADADSEFQSEQDLLAQLVSECASGLYRAFNDLYARTQVQIHRRVIWIVTSVEYAVEVVQETYLDVWLHAKSYDPVKGSVLGWLMMIAHRRAVDRIRHIEASRKRELRHGNLERNLVLPDIGDDVAARIDARSIHQAFHCLSLIQQEVIIMKYVEYRTLQEISDCLRVPLGTVKTRMRDALTKLRRSLLSSDSFTPPTTRASGSPASGSTGADPLPIKHSGLGVEWSGTGCRRTPTSGLPESSAD